MQQGVLPNLQYGEVHVNIWDLKNLLNKYLGPVNYSMDKIQYLGSRNTKEGRIIETGVFL